MAQSEFALHLLIVTVDPPTDLRQLHKVIQRDIFRNRRQTVLPWLRCPEGPVHQEPFLWPGFVQVFVPVGGTHPHREPGSHRAPSSLTPTHRLPALLRQPLGELTGRQRMVSGGAADTYRRSALSAPPFGRQRLCTWRPQARFLGNRQSLPARRSARRCPCSRPARFTRGS